MGLRKGFNASISATYGSSTTAVALKTIGDISINENKTVIPVTNRASKNIRSRPGMVGLSFTFTVQSGVDPADTSGTDAYHWLWTRYVQEDVFSITFTDSATHSRTASVWVSSFNIQDPLDDLETAEVTVELAGHTADDAQTISQSGWSYTEPTPGPSGG